ncbi:aspartic peptidase domain-containing protein [Xylariales sp. AK1849]|nr:aspartic peptidase domain-containing protein [Xylariales sp. AK1849]
MVSHMSPGFLAVWFTLLVLATSVPIIDKLDGVQNMASLPASDGIAKGRLNGPLEYHRTLSKYNIPIPAGLQKTVNRYLQMAPADQVGGVPAISEDGDLLYIAPAGLGSPSQQLYMDFDTGSADTWVFSTDTNKAQVKGQTLYDPTKSDTAQVINNCTWSILYGDFSSSSGLCYRDTFTLGNVSIPNMTIESAKSVSSSFTKQNTMAGLVGLAFSSIIQTVPAQKSLLDFLPAVLKEPIFTTDLRHNSSEGSYNFGYVDHNLHGSDIQYIDIDNSDGFWGCKMTGFATKGSQFLYEFAQPPSIILDTGSTLFYAPDAAVTQYFQSVLGASFSYEEYGWILPCNSTPPDFIWELGDISGTKIQGDIPGIYFVYAVLDDGLTAPGMCYAGLQSLGGLSTLQGIFGDVFLKSGFQVWDAGQNRFGYAPKPLPDVASNETDGEAVAEGAYGQRKEALQKKIKIIID